MKKIISTFTSMTAISLFAALIFSGCAELNDPNFGGSGYYPPPRYDRDNYYNRDRYDDYNRHERREIERERDRLERERRRLEEERERNEHHPVYRVPPPPPQQNYDRCPPGFSPSENKCSPEERKRGCKDVRTPSGLGCVRR